nr:PEP/pyruvate-binding domain-containing protein [uncultured Undibacterium sp.]
MKSNSFWPKHFYLVATDNASHQHKADRNHMGSKAYNLLRMAQIGLPIPPALVIGTHYTQSPEECILPLFALGLPSLQQATAQTFGDTRNPLIVSVRSGAPVSMPGMMETLLNIGLCDDTLPGLLRQSGNPRLVWDAYRRLIASYGEVVAGISATVFENALQELCQGQDERELDFEQLRALSKQYLALYQNAVGKPFPQNVNEQLSGAVRAVFNSWHAEKAQEYRRLNQIDDAIGTAVTIQSMVFGNTGGHSGAGVGFTRNPTNGEAELWIDFLANAQGEDVVSGRRNAHGHQVLAAIAPEAWEQLQSATQALEHEFSDMQDFEFTVQDGVLHILQTRSGKRSALATARIALDLFDQKIIDLDTAYKRTAHLDESQLSVVQLVTNAATQAESSALAYGAPACPGIATGEIALDGERAANRHSAGVPIILVRQDAETNDIAALDLAEGLLTQRGARTSHAAVVARQLGKICLVGCDQLHIDEATRTLYFGDQEFHEGDVITVDGNQGTVYAGAVESVRVMDEALLERLRQLRSQFTEHHHARKKHNK